MKSYTSNKSEHSPKTTGSNRLSRDEVIRGAVYFNVSKIYKETNSYGFESILEVNNSTGYWFKITQTGNTSFYFTNKPLQTEELRTIVKELFDDTISALHEHREQRLLQNKKDIPEFKVSDDVLSIYFSTINYHNLLLACTFKNR